jgi:4-carboxymuconolactone decarboxylase
MSQRSNRSRAIAAFVSAVVVMTGTVAAQDRMPLIPAAEQTDAQKKAVAALTTQNGGTLPVYLNPFIASPEVMLRVNALGDYVVRAKTALDRRQNELVILLVIRHWSQSYMWSNHYALAVRAGLKEDIVKAIGDRRRPAAMSDDEAALYDFCTEVQAAQRVTDDTYARMKARFGDAGILDTLGLMGYYATLSMTYNTTRMPPTAGGAILPGPSTDGR